MLHALIACCALVAVSAQSNTPIPGVSTLSAGFDMVAGVQNNSWTGNALLPVYSMAYTKGKTWTDPSTVPPTTWAVPDDLTLNDMDYSFEEINSALCETYSDYVSIVRKSFTVSAGVTIGSGTKALSANAKFDHESYEYQQQMKTDDTASGFSRHFWALYSLESLPPFLMTLSDAFTAMVQRLPTKISTPADQTLYNYLVQYWGTHTSWKADFGGNVHLSTFVDKSILQSHSQSWVSNQFALTFHYYLFNLSAGGFKNQSSINISSEFKAASHTYLSFKGGDPTLQTNTTVDAWVKTIPTQPVALNNTLTDISTIVSTVDPTKGSLLSGVIKSYIATGKLPATDGSITDYPAYYAQFEDMPMINDPVVLQRLRARRE